LKFTFHIIFLFAYCIICTGVEDNGRLAGLTKEEMKASLKTLKDMASRLGATMRVLRERIATSSASKNLASQHNSNNNNEEKKVAEVLVKKLRKDDREDQDSIVDLRLAVTGAQDAGKSTLLGERIITERIFKVEKNER